MATTPTSRPARWMGAVFTVVVGVLDWIATLLDRFDPVVGAWHVTAPDAPYPYHVFTFHADHTMTQANPDAGNQQTSDSDGAGIWDRHRRTVTGMFAETTADRHTGTPLGTGRISFTLTVTGDQLTGTAEANFYDTDGRHLRGPLPTPLHGQRITANSPRCERAACRGVDEVVRFGGG